MAVDIEQDLKALSTQIDRLRVLYEQHFLGMEKMPPTVPRREAERLLALIGTHAIANTALRFRFLNLVRRWKTHTERWDKVLREIENGTYRPHIVARERREKERSASPSREGPPTIPDFVPPSPVPGMSDAELRELHRRYVDACRSVGDARDVKFEALVASLQRQVPVLLEKKGAQALAFDVTVRDGKVVLRAVPRRGGDAPGTPPSPPSR